MPAKRKTAKKKNAGNRSFRKTKKILRKLGSTIKSSKRRKHVTKGRLGWAANALVDAYTKKNPPRMKRLTKSTGWIAAKRVKIVKRGGRVEVLVQKTRPRRTAKKAKAKRRR